MPNSELFSTVSRQLKTALISEEKLESIFESKFVFPKNQEEEEKFKEMLWEISQTHVGSKLLRELNEKQKITLEVTNIDGGLGEHDCLGKVRIAPFEKAETLIHELEHERQLQQNAVGETVTYEEEILNKGLCEISARMVAAAFCLEQGITPDLPCDVLRIEYFKKKLEKKYPHNEEKQWDIALKSASVCAIMAIKNPEIFWDLDVRALVGSLSNISKKEVMSFYKPSFKLQRESLLQEFYFKTLGMPTEEYWKSLYFQREKNEKGMLMYKDVESFCIALSTNFFNPAIGRNNDFQLYDNFSNYYDVSEAVHFLLSDNLLPTKASENLQQLLIKQTAVGGALERLLLQESLTHNDSENVYNLPDKYRRRTEINGNTVNLYVGDKLNVSKTIAPEEITTVLYNQQGTAYCTIKETDGKKTLTTVHDASQVVVKYDEQNRKYFAELRKKGIKKGYQCFSYDKNAAGEIIASSFNSLDKMTGLSVIEPQEKRSFVVACKSNGKIDTIQMVVPSNVGGVRVVEMEYDTFENIQTAAVIEKDIDNDGYQVTDIRYNNGKIEGVEARLSDAIGNEKLCVSYIPVCAGQQYHVKNDSGECWVLRMDNGSLIKESAPKEKQKVTPKEIKLLQLIQTGITEGETVFKEAVDTVKNKIQQAVQENKMSECQRKDAKDNLPKGNELSGMLLNFFRSNQIR